MRNIIRKGIALLLLAGAGAWAVPAAAQDIRITRGADKTYAEQYMAKIEFVSDCDKLEFSENTGVTMSAPQKINGKYVYSATLDVADGGSLSFMVWRRGSVDKKQLDVSLEENMWASFNVEVTELPLKIESIEVTAPHMTHATAQMALVSVVSNNDGLHLELLKDGAKATNAKMDNVLQKQDGSFEYLFHVDLNGVPATASYSMNLSVGDNPEVKAFAIGTLAQKDGMELTVSVKQEASCFQHSESLAENAFINGLYRDAYFAYKDALECKDKQDEAVIKKKMRNSAILANAKKRVMEHVEKAETFRQSGQMDSCMFYYQDANQYAAAILKMNSNDSYCTKLRRDFSRIRQDLPRVVSGKVVDRAKLDLNKKNLPMANVYVVLCKYAIKDKKVMKVQVYEPDMGKIVDTKTLAKTDADGRFEVFVPWNTDYAFYGLHFVADESEVGITGLKSARYIPTNADIQQGVVVYFVPSRSINRN